MSSEARSRGLLEDYVDGKIQFACGGFDNQTREVEEEEAKEEEEEDKQKTQLPVLMPRPLLPE